MCNMYLYASHCIVVLHRRYTLHHAFLEQTKEKSVCVCVLMCARARALISHIERAYSYSVSYFFARHWRLDGKKSFTLWAICTYKILNDNKWVQARMPRKRWEQKRAWVKIRYGCGRNRVQNVICIHENMSSQRRSNPTLKNYYTIFSPCLSLLSSPFKPLHSDSVIIASFFLKVKHVLKSVEIICGSFISILLQICFLLCSSSYWCWVRVRDGPKWS